MNFHPHVHSVVPAGAVDGNHRLWRTKQGRILFPQTALAKVFRAKSFQAMAAHGWHVQETIPDQWVVDCKRVGNGNKAIIYLGRYLYRDVVREEDNLGIDAETVTFRYVDSADMMNTRTLQGADFLWLLMQHILPRGFRRARDYGFLHANAKKIIRIVQWLFRIASPVPSQRPPLCCRECGGVLRVTIYPWLRKPPQSIGLGMEGIA